MKGVIVNYRRNRHTQRTNYMVIFIRGYDKEKSRSLVGKEAVWVNSKGTAIKGKVTGVHGNKGSVKVLFEKGMPGQSLGTEVEIKS